MILTPKLYYLKYPPAASFYTTSQPQTRTPKASGIGSPKSTNKSVNKTRDRGGEASMPGSAVSSRMEAPISMNDEINVNKHKKGNNLVTLHSTSLQTPMVKLSSIDLPVELPNVQVTNESINDEQQKFND
jgi:hypothetical protein